MPKNGFISASMAKAVLTEGRKKDELYGQTFLSEAKKVGAAMIGWDVSVDISHIPSVQHGNEYEHEAIQVYQNRKLVEVHSQQEWQQTECGRMGCTPDGLVGTDGMIEVKCPLPHNHLDNLLENAQLSTYIGQIQFSLMVTGRAWCDFISYDPFAPEALRLHVYRVQRDEELSKNLKCRAAYMHELAKNYAEQLKPIGVKNER
jgi:hypothetical protein